MTHLDTETLLNGLEGRLDAVALRQMQQHMAQCKDCAETFSGYAALLDNLSGPALEDAPEPAIKKALAVFQAPEQPRKPIVEVIRSLIHDSWADTAAAGLRGEWDTRQVGMSTDYYDLHLSIDYAGARIHGQLLAKNDGGFTPEFRARLYTQSGGELDSNRANEFGEFALANVNARSLLALELDNGVRLQFEIPDGDEK